MPNVCTFMSVNIITHLCVLSASLRVMFVCVYMHKMESGTLVPLHAATIYTYVPKKLKFSMAVLKLIKLSLPQLVWSPSQAHAQKSAAQSVWESVQLRDQHGHESTGKEKKRENSAHLRRQDKRNHLLCCQESSSPPTYGYCHNMQNLTWMNMLSEVWRIYFRI